PQFPNIQNPDLSGSCRTADQTACFYDGGDDGKIPQSQLYSVGLAILKRYPAANHFQTAGQNYNYELGGTGSDPLPIVEQLRQQPAVRVDYQASPKLRIIGTC